MLEKSYQIIIKHNSKHFYVIYSKNSKKYIAIVVPLEIRSRLICDDIKVAETLSTQCHSVCTRPDDNVLFTEEIFPQDEGELSDITLCENDFIKQIIPFHYCLQLEGLPAKLLRDCNKQYPIIHLYLKEPTIVPIHKSGSKLKPTDPYL